ncbi:MAG: phage portal protein [Clostridiales bacterium]|nr:phage portal protein [Clostridiales bacterium]
MQSFGGFLKENALPVENIKYVASKRFVDPEGKPLEWEICAITLDEDEDIRKTCTDPTTKVLNADKYNASFAARCTVFPNLNSAELQDSYGVKGADKLLRAMLIIPGEYIKYLAKVQEANGINNFGSLVEQAKN